jgi:iron complex outermembrane receptor protein
MNLRVRGRLRVIDVLLIAALAVAGPIPAFALETHQFDVPAEDAPSAIRDFATQAHVQILVAGENVKEKHLHPVSGEFSTEQGLRLLLADSGLSPQYIGDRSIALVKASDANSSSQGNAKEGKKGSSGEFRLAQANQGLAQGATVGNGNQSSTNSQNSGTALTEIIVTAEKRSERLQDVPVPVTAVSADTLIASNQPRIQDYYSSIPGLNVTPNIQSEQILSIRGITTGGASNPTVGITVDDVPYGSSTGNGGGAVIPDLDPGDLAQVEVLRGPQGTLYGASSMGGLLKFVTVEPSFDALSGRVQGGIDQVYNGSQVGYNVRGSVNVPITDTLAIRASAFTRQDPGYIDNPILHLDGINEDRVSGGRLSALWRPSQDFSLKLSALIQDNKGNGSNDVDLRPGLGDLQQDYVRGVGAYDRRVQAYSGTITAKLAGIDIISVSGYNVNEFSDSFDYSYRLGQYTQAYFGVGGAPVVNQNKTDKFTQEIRLSAPIGEHFEWLAGGFYTHERSSYVQNILGVDPITGVSAGSGYYLSFPTTYSEYAGFADLTFHLTDRFDIQVGGRESQNKESYGQAESQAIFGAPALVITPQVDSTGHAFTYLVTPRFKLSPDFMVYARLASGYRAGGPNLSAGGIVPSEYAPDKTENYELGIKGDFIDHRLSIDASVYYIDWKDIQLSLLNPATYLGYDANAGSAKSQGVELSIQSRPLTGLTIAGWVVWNDAKLTEAFPASSSAAGGAFGADGDRLPYSSRFSGNLSVDQQFPLSNNVTGFVGGSVSYIGDRQGVFVGAGDPRQTFPGYAKTDLRTGAKYNSWTFNLSVNNLADKRGVLGGGLGTVPPFAFNYIQPRTVGLSVVKLF